MPYVRDRQRAIEILKKIKLTCMAKSATCVPRYPVAIQEWRLGNK